MSRLVQHPEAIDLPLLGRRWQFDVPLLLFDLNVRQEQVNRLTWAATDLGDVRKNGVVVLALAAGVDAAKIVPKGGDVPLGGGLVAHRLQAAGRSGVAIAVDAHTIVAGNEEILRRIAGRTPAGSEGDAPLSNAPLELLLKKLVPSGDLAILVDLTAARADSWRLPADLLDTWPEGKTSWRLLCETPVAMGLAVQAAGDHRCELGLVCPGESMAEKLPGERMAERLRFEMEKLAETAIRTLPGHLAGLKTTLSPDRVGAEAANQYRQVLDDLFVSLNSCSCETSDGIVWLRVNWNGNGLPNWVASLLESKPALEALKLDRLAAARLPTKPTMRDLLKSLLAYAGAKSPAVPGRRRPAAQWRSARKRG